MAEGFRPYPPAHEVLAGLKSTSSSPKQIEGPVIDYPTLVTANWCPFTLTAKSFWNEAAIDAGLTLKVVDAETEEGAQIIVSAGVAGVPCLVAAPDRLLYGLQCSPSEAISFLQS